MGKFIETDLCQLSEGWGHLGMKWEMTASGHEVSSWGDEKVLNLIVVTVAQLCE